MSISLAIVHVLSEVFSEVLLHFQSFEGVDISMYPYVMVKVLITDCKVCTCTSAGVVGDWIHYWDETVA